VHYALLIYETPDAFAKREEAEEESYFGAWRTYYRSLVEAGVYVGGDPLHMPETGTTVRRRDGRRQIQDGPYAHTKEQLAGFIVVNLSSLDSAMEWAARCPASAYGAVEVRPIATEHKQRITHGID
jgi:hypothetical protein